MVCSVPLLTYALSFGWFPLARAVEASRSGDPAPRRLSVGCPNALMPAVRRLATPQTHATRLCTLLVGLLLCTASFCRFLPPAFPLLRLGGPHGLPPARLGRSECPIAAQTEHARRQSRTTTPASSA